MMVKVFNTLRLREKALLSVSYTQSDALCCSLSLPVSGPALSDTGRRLYTEE